MLNSAVADPWAETDAAELLNDIHTFVGRFVSYPSDHAHVAHTLWIAHTHLLDACESTPRLAFLSPEPGSGKSRALEVTELLVPRPMPAVNVSVSYLYRSVSAPAGRPTVLYDEVDCVFGAKASGDSEDIRGLLNAGHRRGAIVGRCVVRGKSVELEDFPVFAAVAMAGLGDLPDTLLSRSIIIRMRRRAPNEFVEAFRRRVHFSDGDQLREKIAAWAEVTGPSITDVWPEMPDSITDRDADLWEAIFAIADAAGGEWPKRARVAAVALVADTKRSTPSLGIRLLADLRTVFGDTDLLATEHILLDLHKMDEAPWGDLRGKPLDARGLARRLRPYDVKPTNVRTLDSVVKGYRRADLYDAWQRYLGPPTDESATAATPATFQVSAA